jgi:putative DNA primase/helicase
MNDLVPLEKAERHRQRQPVNNDVVTEDSAALQFAERHASQLLFCHDAKAWYRWSGSHWQIEKTGLAFEWAREQARELAERESPKARFIISKTSFATGVERFSRADRTFAVTADGFDADPFLLGTPGGTVDLSEGRLRPASPDDRITKITAIAPDDIPDCPLWLRFLAEATGGDHELVRFLQQLSGYALSGDTREHALVFIYGPGGNGKSVFLNVVTGIMSAYASIAAMDTFTASYGDKHTTDLAMLRGARLVTASETEEGRPWAEARIKQMTGGDPITARFMRQDNFTFRPAFKLIIVGNHKPVLHNVDEAARRRFNIVPFTKRPAQPDQELEGKLRGEWPGILRWMIEGCLDWLHNGLLRPKAVTAATSEYFSDQDVLGQWLDEECDAEPGNPHKFEKTSDLFGAWTAYAIKSGEKPGSAKAFGATLQRRGFEPYRTKETRGYRGLRLKRRPSYQDPEGDA